jgi:hypothetical protein
MPETFVICFDAIPLKESCSRWKLPWLSQTLKMQNLHVFGRRLAKGLLHVSSSGRNPEVRNQKIAFLVAIRISPQTFVFGCSRI